MEINAVVHLYVQGNFRLESATTLQMQRYLFAILLKCVPGKLAEQHKVASPVNFFTGYLNDF